MTGLLYLLSSKLQDVFSDYKVRSLIDQAFSTKPSVKILARAHLKKDYPDVYAELLALGDSK